MKLRQLYEASLLEPETHNTIMDPQLQSNIMSPEIRPSIVKPESHTSFWVKETENLADDFVKYERSNGKSGSSGLNVIHKLNLLGKRGVDSHLYNDSDVEEVFVDRLRYRDDEDLVAGADGNDFNYVTKFNMALGKLNHSAYSFDEKDASLSRDFIEIHNRKMAHVAKERMEYEQQKQRELEAQQNSASTNDHKESNNSEITSAQSIESSSKQQEIKSWWQEFLKEHPTIDNALTTMGEHPIATAAGVALVSLGMYKAARMWKEYKRRKQAESINNILKS